MTSLQTMQEIYDHSLARTSFTPAMLAIAGAMALLLGIIGIYGVLAYTVAQRRREVGNPRSFGRAACRSEMDVRALRADPH